MIATIFISITAFVYANILSQPGEIFGKWYGFLNNLFQTDKRISSGKQLHPLFKMMIGCEKCVSGQLALWYFMANNYGGYFIGVREFILTAFQHSFFIATTIFLTTIIKSLYEKYIN